MLQTFASKSLMYWEQLIGGPFRIDERERQTGIALLCSPSRGEARLSARAAEAAGKKGMAAQSWERSLRRRLIRLLSAGWLPPSVSSSRGAFLGLKDGRRAQARPHN